MGPFGLETDTMNEWMNEWIGWILNSSLQTLKLVSVSHKDSAANT